MPMKCSCPVALFLVLLVVPSAAAQDGPPLPPLPPVPGNGPAAKPDVVMPELEPGVLPADTKAGAREMWSRIVAASVPGQRDGAAHAPVTAFDLSLDVRYKATDGQSNDMPDARYRWLTPGHVRAETGRGRTHLRGPKGSYVIDDSKPGAVERIAIDVGRENAEDRRQLEEVAGLAGNFARLTDPRGLRIARLASATVPTALLPQSVHERAAKLVWMEIESPDFAVMRSSRPGPRMARVRIGADPKTAQVELAVVDEAGGPARVVESTAVLRFVDVGTIDGFAVPKQILVWLPEVGDAEGPPRGATLRPSPAMDIYVKRASLRPELKASDFLP